MLKKVYQNPSSSPLSGLSDNVNPNPIGLFLSEKYDVYLKWLRCKEGFLKSSKSTSKKCLKIVILTFDKYKHTTHVIITTMFQGLFKYIKGMVEMACSSIFWLHA